MYMHTMYSVHVYDMRYPHHSKASVIHNTGYICDDMCYFINDLGGGHHCKIPLGHNNDDKLQVTTDFESRKNDHFSRSNDDS